MANNRMYIRCQCCGEALFLGKRLLGGYHYEGEQLGRKLNDFYEEHTYCDKPKIEKPYVYDEEESPIPENCSVLDCFEIVYEFGRE